MTPLCISRSPGSSLFHTCGRRQRVQHDGCLSEPLEAHVNGHVSVEFETKSREVPIAITCEDL